MTLMSRKTFRHALADLIESRLAGPGGILQAVYAYGARDFGGQSPVVTITSDGSLRKMTFESGEVMPGPFTKAYLDVHIFVAYSVRDDGYTEADSEDALDDVEAAIMSLVHEFSKGGVDMPWFAIRPAGRSKTSIVQLGDLYRYEHIPLELDVSVDV